MSQQQEKSGLVHSTQPLNGAESLAGKRVKRSVAQAVFDSADAKRIQRQGHAEACRELANTPRHLLGDGNPNHPMYDLHLFGIPANEFMARQYKAA
jgi:hypothetical protein